MQKEQDPNGIPAHAPGSKLDQGKLLAGVLDDFAPALKAVAQVGTFGANKYSRGGWRHVENGVTRYNDAGQRHRLVRLSGEHLDPDSGLPHEFHEAWNVLAGLTLKILEWEKMAAEEHSAPDFVIPPTEGLTPEDLVTTKTVADLFDASHFWGDLREGFRIAFDRTFNSPPREDSENICEVFTGFIQSIGPLENDPERWRIGHAETMWKWLKKNNVNPGISNGKA